MRKLLPSILLLIVTFIAEGQNITGQWKGSFIDKSTSRRGFEDDKCEYVLELNSEGTEISGTSYTYFTENGKRFYTICKVEGSLDKKKKLLEIKEVERTKTNIPSNIRNCFQIHKLTYFKKDDTETIEGAWEPAPNQSGGAGGCGFGTTILTKRTLINSYPKAYANANRPANSQKIPTEPNKKQKTTTPSKSTAGNNKEMEPQKSTIDNNHPDATEINTFKNSEVTKTTENKTIAPLDSKLEKRKITVLKTIEVESNSIKVDLYDNGEIDGDSISLFYNGKLILSNQRLTEKSLKLVLDVDNNSDVNELVMYAENLGTFPPNTALMVVTDGPNRYEVRITSDLEKSGVIHFIHKPQK